jgi:hypothetical protein
MSSLALEPLHFLEFFTWQTGVINKAPETLRGS